MNDTTRARLKVSSDSFLPLGPLSVEVIPEGGDPIEFALSSGQTSHEVSVAPGRYTVIARRPNGSRLRRSVVLSSGQDANVNLMDDVPSSPNEFMAAETNRGDVTPGPIVKHFGGNIGRLQGLNAQTLGAMTTARAFGVSRGRETARAPGGASWTLCAWGFAGEQANSNTAQLFSDLGRSFLKVSTNRRCLALGLLDEDGLGPIVITPPFRRPLHVTFLAEGLAARAGARYLNPSGQRAPVALATPEEPSVADLLAALGSASVEHADAVWQQNLSGPANAQGFVYEKYENPTEALLGAHYLLRFLPDRLPIAWADNLGKVLPEAADGPVIAAWLRLESRAPEVLDLDPKQVSRDCARLLEDAARRPITLFARTRRLLVDGMRLNPSTRSSKSARAKAADPSDFLNYGAQAAGLEAFWGSDPESPGTPARRSRLPRVEIARVTLNGSIFTD